MGCKWCKVLRSYFLRGSCYFSSILFLGLTTLTWAPFDKSLSVAFHFAVNADKKVRLRRGDARWKVSDAACVKGAARCGMRHGTVCYRQTGLYGCWATPFCFCTVLSSKNNNYIYIYTFIYFNIFIYYVKYFWLVKYYRILHMFIYISQVLLVKNAKCESKGNLATLLMQGVILSSHLQHEPLFLHIRGFVTHNRNPQSLLEHNINRIPLQSTQETWD